MMNEGLSCLTTNLETNSNFTRSNSGADGGTEFGQIPPLGGSGLGGWWGLHIRGCMLLKSAAQANLQTELALQLHQDQPHHCLQSFSVWLHGVGQVV